MRDRELIDVFIDAGEVMVAFVVGVAMMVAVWFVGVRLLGWLAGVFG